MMSTEEHQNTKDWRYPRYQPTKDTNKYNSFLQAYKTGIAETAWPFNHKNTSNLKLALPNPSYIYTKMMPMQDGSHNMALLSTKLPIRTKTLRPCPVRRASLAVRSTFSAVRVLTRPHTAPSQIAAELAKGNRYPRSRSVKACRACSHYIAVCVLQ